ncbi:hypothetical protein LCGC14_2992770, partial [marine sediment metagenome]
ASYTDYLIKKGIIPLAERFDYLTTKKHEVLETLIGRLYETEEYKGVTISTLSAFWHFCEFVIYEDPIKGKRIWNIFIKELFQDVERHRYCSIWASRTMGKSYFAHGLYILFKAFLFRNTEFLLITNIPKQYKRNIRILKKIIMSNELLLQKKEEGCIWTQTEVEYNGGLMQAQSVGTPPRGEHVEYIFVDDCLRDDNKISEEELDDFIRGQLIPCAQRWKSRLVLTGTPLHITDIYHGLMNTEPDMKGRVITDGNFSYCGFYSKAYPIITDYDKKEIYLEDLFSWEELITNTNSVRNVQGDTLFNREYLLICTDKSTSIFSHELLKDIQDNSLKVVYMDDHDGNYITGADVATSGAASADNTAIVT